MANQQEPVAKQSGEQLKLVYSVRDQLITGLIHLSTILQCDRSPPANEKQRTREKTKESVLLLMDLSPVEKPPPAEDSRWVNLLTFELPRPEKTRIVTHLMDIMDAVLSDQPISKETKSSLITENKRAINQLLELPCEVRDDVIDGAGSAEEENTEPPSKKQRASPMSAEVDSDMNERLNCLDTVIKNQREKIARCESKMNELKGELKREIRKVDITRAEASVQFKLTGVRKFFEVVGEGFSNQFWCRGLKWSVKLKVKSENNVKQLGVFLFCHNEDWVNWSCKADYELTLFTNLPEKRNYVYKGASTFDDKYGYGFELSFRDLSDKNNGYIENDSIRLGVQLKAGPVMLRCKKPEKSDEQDSESSESRESSESSESSEDSESS